MRNFEVTFIVDPVLSGDEVKSTAQTYRDMLHAEGARIIHVDEIGLRQLAYPINKRSTGVYYCMEFESEQAAFISKFELALKRDERIMRYLTVKLDKYGVKYNEDKRNGKIGKRMMKEKVNPNPFIASVPPPPPGSYTYRRRIISFNLLKKKKNGNARRNKIPQQPQYRTEKEKILSF
ncbi:MAG: 30S ribosomal protein S6 [Saprospiraceae bacterium]|nr:30S ribosomal protein S6 [Saprospiraceae bacterium]